MSSKSPGRKRKSIIYKVLMLDDQEVPFQIEQKTIGLDLVNLVYQYLKLIESDYFSLIFIDNKGKKCWIDYDKPIVKQLSPETRLIFCVKFYTPDPGQLEEEYTRYLYALQIKRDLAEGLLLCSDATASLLASYILQAEIGDYNEMYDNNPNYFQDRKFFPHQNVEHEMKIIDYHKNHIGQSPADADLNLLDIARKVELYGIIMHSAKDHEGVCLNLAVAHMGILVFQNYTKINTFSWAKIRKLSFKRRKFLIKLHPENYGFYKDTVEFYLENRDDSKNFWKECIEHHSFFRCVSSSKNINKNNKSKLLTRGSSFRYYGRTQKEVIENARESFPKNRTFDRTYNSMRNISAYVNENGGGITSGQPISGTQSLNRNLCSRMNNNNNNSNTSNLPSSARESPRLMHNSNNNRNVKSATLRSHDTTTSSNSHIIDTPSISLIGINTNHHHNEDEDDDDDDDDDDVISNHHRHHIKKDNDASSTHGSRTIDSRFSRDKMLVDDNDGDDGDDDNEEPSHNNNNNNNNNNKSDSDSDHHHHGNNEDIADIDDIDNANDDINIKSTSSFNKLPKFNKHNQQEKLKNNIEQINNALKKELTITNGSSSSSPPPISIPQPPSASVNEIPTQQQQQQKTPSPTINVNNNTTTTNSSSSCSSNMNKIYSRKEVITIKEETKNIYNEEYTTQQTIYQQPYYIPASSIDSSSERLKFYNSYDQITKQQQQQQPVPPAPTTSSSTASTSTTTTTFTKLNNNNNNKNNKNNDDDVSDGSNNNNNQIRLSRPKSLLTTRQFSPPTVFTNRNVYNNDNDDDLPPPPPPPTESTSTTIYAHSKHQPLILDYQDPINLVQYESNSINQFVLPINIESKHCKPYSQSSNQINIDDEFKKKKCINDDSYFITKELLMTERTYRKDLELTLMHFQNSIRNLNQHSEFLCDFINFNVTPIYDFHVQFLKDLEQRLTFWNDEKQKIGDLLSNINIVLKYYKSYIEKYDEMLNELELVCRKNKKFDSLYKEFETQKICYLPFTLFLLKPIQRILHYKLLFEKLLIYYGRMHFDYQDIYSIFMKIEDLILLIYDSINSIENKQKLMELQRELIGAENLVPVSSRLNRNFIREGSLQKLSRKGYQQRMFFLFNDVLLYCARSSSPILQFKIHGEYPLKNLQIEDGNSRINIPNSFTIYSSNRSILVAAISNDEKVKWLNDIAEAVEKFKSGFDEKQNYASLKSNSSSENNLEATNFDDDDATAVAAAGQENENSNNNNYSSSIAYQNSPSIQQHRSNTTMHVCWHRNISVSSIDNHNSVSNQLSGYLLRKFKNSNGWQKLWVVFTNFCLFFYKTYQDEYPLASLPLLGYTVTIPNETDNITKDYVFKLQFKNHVYFFRTDSQYSFDRWMDVISSAAQKL